MQSGTPVELVELDIVTPTCNRSSAMIEQAERLGPQLGPRDRWLIVDDASNRGFDPLTVIGYLPDPDQLLAISLSYAKGNKFGTVNRARHAGCSLARPNAWIIEIDDHDLVYEGCLDHVRQAIADGATFIYADSQQTSRQGRGDVYVKPDYKPWLLRDGCCPCEGVRGYPKWLYELVGGYRWHGDCEVNGNEFPAGDYGLFLRMEEALEGERFVRIPHVLCEVPKVAGGISTRFVAQQGEMARKLRSKAQNGGLL